MYTDVGVDVRSLDVFTPRIPLYASNRKPNSNSTGASGRTSETETEGVADKLVFMNGYCAYILDTLDDRNWYMSAIVSTIVSSFIARRRRHPTKHTKPPTQINKGVAVRSSLRPLRPTHSHGKERRIWPVGKWANLCSSELANNSASKQ